MNQNSTQIKIPKGWKIEKINQLCTVVRGGSPRPKGDPKYFDGPIPWIKISDATNERGKFITKTKEGLKKAGISKSRLLKSGTLVLTNSATICLPKILKMDGCIHDGFLAFLDLKKLDKFFLYYFFMWQRQRITREVARGMAQKNLNTTLIGELEISIPPLKVQKQIVHKLDSIFLELDNHRKNISNLEEKIMISRNNLKKSITNYNFSNPLKKLEESSLGSLTLTSQNGCTGSPNTLDSGVKRLGIETVTQSANGFINESYAKFFDATKNDIEKYSVKKNDLFVCRQNGNKHFVGKFGIYLGNITSLIFSDSLIKFKIDSTKILPEYVVHYMNNFSTRKEIDPYCKTLAGNYSINAPNLKKVIIKYPKELEEQRQIIEEKNRYQTKSIEIFQTIDEYNKLRNDLLKKFDTLYILILNTIFSGKLVK